MSGCCGFVGCVLVLSRRFSKPGIKSWLQKLRRPKTIKSCASAAGLAVFAYLVDHQQVVSPIISGISRINALITRVIAYLLSGVIHQVADLPSMCCL